MSGGPSGPALPGSSSPLPSSAAVAAAPAGVGITTGERDAGLTAPPGSPLDRASADPAATGRRGAGGWRPTTATWFSVAGWAVFALLIWRVAVPAARYGDWAAFGQLTTWDFLWDGLKVTMVVGVVAMLVSSVIGFFLALGRVSHQPLLSGVSTFYIELTRALPSYLIIFYVFIVLPKIGVRLEALWFAVIGLVLYTSAVMAEVFRAGILSVDKGQLEAAYSLGLHPRETVWRIVLPQAIRRMVPALVSQLITLTKDTSLAAIIGLQELTRKGQQLYQYTNAILETMFVVGMIYFVVCYVLALLSQRLEIRTLR